MQICSASLKSNRSTSWTLTRNRVGKPEVEDKTETSIYITAHAQNSLHIFAASESKYLTDDYFFKAVNNSMQVFYISSYTLKYSTFLYLYKSCSHVNWFIILKDLAILKMRAIKKQK